MAGRATKARCDISCRATATPELIKVPLWCHCRHPTFEKVSRIQGTLPDVLRIIITPMHLRLSNVMGVTTDMSPGVAPKKKFTEEESGHYWML